MNLLSYQGDEDLVQQQTPDPVLLVSDFDELRTLVSSRQFYSKLPLALQLPGLPPDEAFTIAERLNAYRNECGCSLGAKFMMAGFAFTTVWLVIQPNLLSTMLLWRLPLAFGIVIAAAGFGKFTGITLARRQARREVEFLLKTVSN